MDDIQHRGPGNNPYCDKADNQRLAQQQARKPDHRRQHQQGGDFGERRVEHEFHG